MYQHVNSFVKYLVWFNPLDQDHEFHQPLGCYFPLVPLCYNLPNHYMVIENLNHKYRWVSSAYLKKIQWPAVEQMSAIYNDFNLYALICRSDLSAMINRNLSALWPGGGGGGGYSLVGYLGRCGPKEYRFSAVLVRKRESILAILVVNRVWFLHSSIVLYILYSSIGVNLRRCHKYFRIGRLVRLHSIGSQFTLADGPFNQSHPPGQGKEIISCSVNRNDTLTSPLGVPARFDVPQREEIWR